MYLFANVVPWLFVTIKPFILEGFYYTKQHIVHIINGNTFHKVKAFQSSQGWSTFYSWDL